LVAAMLRWCWNIPMPTELDLPAGHYLPHAGPMCLLQRIVAVDEGSLAATTMFGDDNLFCRDGRIGAWVSLECMAQAVAAWAGYQERAADRAPRIGLLLGTRRFDCHRPWLPLDRPLRFEVTREIQLADGLGQFTGRTLDGDEVLATAVITVIAPEDPLAVIRGGAGG
jgi:predicted hotdog family 3-hydroxylacyl-ACP dehydratase